MGTPVNLAVVLVQSHDPRRPMAQDAIADRKHPHLFSEDCHVSDSLTKPYKALDRENERNHF